MHCLGGVVRAKTPTLFAADFACGREPTFFHRICGPDGLAPNKKRKARDMSSPIDDARTVVGNLRYAHEHVAAAYQAVLSCCRAIWTEVVESTPAGVLS